MMMVTSLYRDVFRLHSWLLLHWVLSSKTGLPILLHRLRSWIPFLQRVASSGKGKGCVKKKVLHKPKKSGAFQISPSPLDSAAAGPSGRQPKIAKLAPDVEATNQLKKDISLQCFGPSSPEETPKKRKKPRRIISSSEDEEPVHVHAQAPSGKFFLS